MPLIGTSASQNTKSFLAVLGGYFAGGYDGTSYMSTISKVSFLSDAVSNINSTLTTTKYFANAMAYSGTAGYIACGQNGSGDFSNIDKLSFNEEMACDAS